MIDASACKPARRAARMHVPRAGVHVGEHACTCFVLTCTSASMRASASCSHACRQECVHVSRADLHIDVHACMCQVQAHRRDLRASRLTCALAVSATRSHFILQESGRDCRPARRGCKRTSGHCKPTKRCCRKANATTSVAAALSHCVAAVWYSIAHLSPVKRKSTSELRSRPMICAIS